jgi:hypothetical protein
LGQLHDRAQLIHCELVPLEREQKPAPRRIGEGCHLPEQGGRRQTFHPFIRIEGYKDCGQKSSVFRCGFGVYFPFMIRQGVALERRDHRVCAAANQSVILGELRTIHFRLCSL